MKLNNIESTCKELGVACQLLVTAATPLVEMFEEVIRKEVQRKVLIRKFYSLGLTYNEKKRLKELNK